MSNKYTNVIQGVMLEIYDKVKALNEQIRELENFIELCKADMILSLSLIIIGELHNDITKLRVRKERYIKILRSGVGVV